MRLCGCGCGEYTLQYTKTDKRKGWVKGKYRPYVQGHQQQSEKYAALVRKISSSPIDKFLYGKAA